MKEIEPLITDQNEFENRVKSKVVPFSNRIILYNLKTFDFDSDGGTQANSYAESWLWIKGWIIFARLFSQFPSHQVFDANIKRMTSPSNVL